MSGGSFNYLFVADPFDLPEKMETLEAMQRTLAGLGYADDVAQATQAVIDKIKEVQARFDAAYGTDGLEQARYKRGDLEDIRDRDADDEAEYQKVNRELDEAEREIGNLSAPLYWIWKGIEWWHSSDTCEDNFKEDLANYRRPPAKEDECVV